LDQGAVNKGQDFFGDRLGGWQKPCAQARHGKDGLGDFLDTALQNFGHGPYPILSLTVDRVLASLAELNPNAETGVRGIVENRPIFRIILSKTNPSAVKISNQLKS
jgi:hypothetical protein